MEIVHRNKSYHNLPRGILAYTGSALGPGGLKRRLERHLRGEKKNFWHIDDLLTRAHIMSVIYALTSYKMECAVNKEISAIQGSRVIKNFGSSDCTSQCGGHLVWLKFTELKMHYLPCV
jgi:Uri superfamily endonuclease